MRLLDPGFRYVPAAKTDVLATWRRFGFRPLTDAERRARQRTGAPEAEQYLATPLGDYEPRAAEGRRQADLKLAS